ncbi:MAG TPA: TRAP transporter small permease [Casimicrobiaceae bacterium]|nr:TRAP transporter small permease [Casimicrobiaceae bacterium]
MTSERRGERVTSPLALALRGIRRALRRIASAMNAAAGWMFFACALFITFDVLARRYLGFSSKSTTEVTGYMLAFGMSWGLAHTLFERSHVRVDLFVNRVPLGLRRYLHVTALALLTVFAAYATYGAVALALESLDFGATDMSALRTPLVVPQALWAFGLAMLLVTVLELLLEAIVLSIAGNVADVDALVTSRSYEEESAEAIAAAQAVAPPRS